MSISVIIPAYNSAAWLAETIDSVLRQTLPATDVLVVDDGSTDSTGDIGRAFPSPVRVIRIENSKLGAARNFGVSQVATDWVAFLDADDLWLPEKLERQMAELARNPGADLCYTGRVKFTVNRGEKEFGTVIPGPPVEEIRDALFKRATFVPSSVMIRRSTLNRVGGFHPDPEVAEDWDLWLRLLHTGVQFASCPDPLLLYRIHDGSMTADGMKLLAKNTRVYREHVLPHLSGLKRLIATNRFLGENQAAAAKAMRKRNDRRCLPMLTKAILRLPFDDPYRYREWLGLVYRGMRSGAAPKLSTRVEENSE